MEPKDIAKRLKAVPDKTAFALASGVSRATIYRIMNGWKNPEYQTLLLIDRQLKKQEPVSARKKAAAVSAQ